MTIESLFFLSEESIEGFLVGNLFDVESTEQEMYVDNIYDISIMVHEDGKILSDTFVVLILV